QGGPGTGKTAVGLHRAAYLLYSDPSLAREGVLVVGPNDVFVAYIEQVLPALGETDVEQKSAEALVHARGERVHEPPEVAALKGSGAMADVLETLLWSRVSVPEADVEVPVGRTRVAVTPADVRDAIAAARERSRSYQSARERFRARLAGVVAGALNPGEATTEGDLLRAVGAAKEFTKLADKVLARVTAAQLFGWLFNRKRLDGRLSPAEIDLLVAHK